MQSMTGFGRGEARDEHLEISVEVSSVNRKSLEVMCSLPREWQSLERDLTDMVRASALRGKVSVYVNATKVGQGGALDWDDEQLAATVKRLRAFARAHELSEEISAEALVRIIMSLDSGSGLPEADAAKALVESALKGALEGFTAMRAEEGAALAQDFSQRIGLLAGHVEQMRQQAGGTVPKYREILFQRLQKAGLELDLDDERVLKEIALFADRSDVTEELTRLASHLEQFTATMREDGAIGRKMDFLCQEINREINTVGSKANHLELTRLVLECKNELERIREQAQNVE